jgi:hypothetical protein
MGSFRPCHRLVKGGNSCDFCRAPEVESLYHCNNFEWEGARIFKSETGRWAACWQCSRFIDQQLWTRLHSRVMRAAAKREGITPETLALLRHGVRTLHKGFAANMAKNTLRIHAPRVRVVGC